MTESTRDKDEQFYTLYVQIPGGEYANQGKKFNSEVEALTKARAVIGEYVRDAFHRGGRPNGVRVYVLKSTALVEYEPPEPPLPDIKVSPTKTPVEKLEEDKCECDVISQCSPWAEPRIVPYDGDN